MGFKNFFVGWSYNSWHHPAEKEPTPAPSITWSEWAAPAPSEFTFIPPVNDDDPPCVCPLCITSAELDHLVNPTVELKHLAEEYLGKFSPATFSSTIWYGESVQPPVPNPVVTELSSAIPALKLTTKCPHCEVTGSAIYNLIMHLNDEARWTREAIADWLETLDVDLQFNLPESPESTEGI